MRTRTLDFQEKREPNLMDLQKLLKGSHPQWSTLCAFHVDIRAVTDFESISEAR